MAQMPDFRFQSGMSMDAIIQAYQQKAAQEQQSRQHADQMKMEKYKGIAQMFQGGAAVVNGLVQNSQRQQMQAAQAAVSDWLKLGSQPEMSPMQGYVQAMGQMVPAQAMQEGLGGIMEPMQAPTGRQMSDTEAYKAQLAALVTKAFPEDAGKQLSKQAFAQLAPQESKPSEMSPLKPMVINGEPKMVREDKQTGNLVLRDGTPVPVDAELEPYNAGFYQNVRLTDRDRQDTSLQQQTNLVLEGKLLPGGAAALRTPRGQKIAALATEMDPDFDFQTYEVRQRIRRDFSTGDSKKAADALDTLLFHANDAYKALDKLDSSKVRGYNKMKNLLQRELKGNPELAALKVLDMAVKNETLKVTRGSGPITISEQAHINKISDPEAAPEEAKAALAAFIKLAGGRFKTIDSNWKHTMGDAKTPYPIMNETSRQILRERGYDPDTMESIEQPQQQTGGDLGAALRQLLPKRK